ncbi:MAG: hypothetical protein ACFLMY_05010 [Candidatus Brachytrichaceae bacterium NZ_4S206]|jgi:hypothetical protein
MSSTYFYRGYSVWPIRFKTHVWSAEIRLRSGPLVHTLREVYPSQSDAIRAAKRWIDDKLSAERHERAMRRIPPRSPLAMLAVLMLLAGVLLITACSGDSSDSSIRELAGAGAQPTSSPTATLAPTETPDTPQPTPTPAPANGARYTCTVSEWTYHGNGTYSRVQTCTEVKP